MSQQRPKIRKPISEAALRGGTRQIIFELEDIRQRLAGYEMFRTYHQISKAIQEIGWELASKLDKQAKKAAGKDQITEVWPCPRCKEELCNLCERDHIESRSAAISSINQT